MTLRIQADGKIEGKTGSEEAVTAASPIRMLAIIVVYKMSPLQTPSFLSLQQAKLAVPEGKLELRILLYDNSCDGQDPGILPDGVECQAASQNLGLSHAYNQALVLAAANGYEWLVTLDQDTVLPSNFLRRIVEIATDIGDDSSVAAIVPVIKAGEKCISPTWFLGGALPRYYAAGEAGIATHDTYAFNSASTLRVAALYEVGGYNPWFWLDCSDGYIFRQLHRHGKRVFIAGDLEVAHDFAMMDLQTRVSLNRYWNLRSAESAFWDLEMGTFAGLERTLSLVRLALKHLLLRASPEHRSITFEFLKRRIFWTKRKRLAAWKHDTLDLFPALSRNQAPPFI